MPKLRRLAAPELGHSGAFAYLLYFSFIFSGAFGAIVSTAGDALFWASARPPPRCSAAHARQSAPQAILKETKR
jgi:hypothetical protein